MSKKIIIIGGGIGGATAALALQKIGAEVEIFERAPELREVGAGLALWAAPFRALERLGVGEKIRQSAAPLRFSEIGLPAGEVIRRLELEKVLGAEFNENYIIHRADLHAAILSGLETSVVRTGHECRRIEQNADGVRVFFKNGAIAEGALLIGADGFHSVVRGELFGETATRYSGQTCFRAVVDTPALAPSVLAEIQGRGQRFGIAPIDENRVYWFAALNAAQGEKDDPAARREHLLEKYRNWAFGIPEMIAATRSERILRNDLIDRPPLKTWTKGRVALLGDAAHPMLPNLGQGACTAIEDGYVLAKSIAEEGVNGDSLKAYETERIGRATRIVNQSWQFGISVSWERPLAVWLRNKMLELSPEYLTEKLFRDNICYDVGDLKRQTKSRIV